MFLTQTDGVVWGPKKAAELRYGSIYFRTGRLYRHAS